VEAHVRRRTGEARQALADCQGHDPAATALAELTDQLLGRVK
jgi:hypothetical protein